MFFYDLFLKTNKEKTVIMICDEHFLPPVIVYIIGVFTIFYFFILLFNIIYALKFVNRYTIIFLFLRKSYECYIIAAALPTIIMATRHREIIIITFCCDRTTSIGTERFSVTFNGVSKNIKYSIRKHYILYPPVPVS